jgi:hypothetical protein
MRSSALSCPCTKVLGTLFSANFFFACLDPKDRTQPAENRQEVPPSSYFQNCAFCNYPPIVQQHSSRLALPKQTNAWPIDPSSLGHGRSEAPILVSFPAKHQCWGRPCSNGSRLILEAPNQRWGTLRLFLLPAPNKATTTAIISRE